MRQKTSGVRNKQLRWRENTSLWIRLKEVVRPFPKKESVQNQWDKLK